MSLIDPAPKKKISIISHLAIISLLYFSKQTKDHNKPPTKTKQQQRSKAISRLRYPGQLGELITGSNAFVCTDGELIALYTEPVLWKLNT